jgi:S-DNA-T family DNA segregation ATPase FtsK/SpoIIIE
MPQSTRGPQRELAGFLVAGAGLFLLIALLSFERSDDPERAFPAGAEVRNVGGVAGRAAASFLFDWVGAAPSYGIAIVVLACGLAVARRRRAAEAPRNGELETGNWKLGTGNDCPPAALVAMRPLGFVALVFGVATIEHLLHRSGAIPGEALAGRNPGGYWGSFLAGALLRRFDPAIGYALASVGGLCGLALAVDLDVGRVRRRFAGRLRTGNWELETGNWELGSRGNPTTEAPASAALSCESILEPAELEALLEAPAVGEPAESGSTPEAPATLADVAEETRNGEQGAGNAEFPVPSSQFPVPGSQFPVPSSQFPVPSSPPNDRYALPPLSMLTPAQAAPAEEYETATREKAGVLERTLADFKIEARVVDVDRGPNITQYDLALAAGVKVHQVMSLADDLAIALKAPPVRIVYPLSGRSTIGVEVPNQNQETVRLRELVASDEHCRKQHAIPLFLGKDSTGTPLVADLARMPHLLVAGATGSGKSVCMNTIITSILLTRRPDEVKMILIDPKMVELSLYESIPHLLAPVVTDMRKAPAVLEWAVGKMEERYALLSRVSVRHVTSYNALGQAEIASRLGLAEEDLEKERVPRELPYIVVVIDEFADLMCVARKEVEEFIVRLAQKARAVGIHLILATQRPTADVITGLIKSNLPCRVAFQVASKVDSRTIIDKNGAENLVGQGDMLYLPPGTANVIRAQGTYVSEDEVKAVVKFTRAAAQPEFQPELLRWEGGEGASDGGDGPEDELYDKAVRIVLESSRGSASLLQRRLEIGYSRASRLIDIMTERGVLGPFKGSKARELLVTLEEWDAMQARKGDA